MYVSLCVYLRPFVEYESEAMQENFWPFSHDFVEFSL